MNLTPEQLASLVHAFETLEGIEHRIDLRRLSRGSYAAALRSMGQDLDRVAAAIKPHSKRPVTTLELLVLSFHPDSLEAAP